MQHVDPFYLKEQLTNNPSFDELIEVKHYYTTVDGVEYETFNVKGYAGIVVGSQRITFSESQTVLQHDAEHCISNQNQENEFIKFEELNSAPFDYLIMSSEHFSPEISFSKKDFFRRTVLVDNAVEFVYKSGATVTIPVYQADEPEHIFYIENK